ncbi:hypothetical protein [Psychromonas sp. SR45-3]|uniref:hypothetical protein n=1 Tax=Psychromonas sp. SR45-3 TaxID=2760930 RepID=UPI0015F7C57A|nr:hypothetical protein [Psychromonas sp. SR45-3]MBB1272503.1 hypothetical protein [Psychromonas sp. SR45-3]
MSINKKSDGVLTSAIAGLSTILIALLQYNPTKLDADLIIMLSTCSPVVSAAVISTFYWLFLQGNGETIEQKAVNSQLSRQIKFLRKQIKTNKKQNICTERLHETLNNTIESKAKQYK